jgi:hypothetical protein
MRKISKNINYKNYKTSRKQTAFATIIVLLMLASAIAALPAINAQIGVSQPRKTEGYISASPTLLGVGQQLTINLWVCPTPTAYSTSPYFKGYSGISVTFTRPDGTTDTFTPTSATGVYDPGVTEALGSMYFYYKPNVAGNWSVKFTMPAQNLTETIGTVQVTACTSKPTYFTVQQNQVLSGMLNGYPWSSLPTGYWTYPINSNNREWSQIAGNWLGYGWYWQPYGSAPSTAHILWKDRYNNGGIIAGNIGSISYQSGQSQPLGIIIEGLLIIPHGTINMLYCYELSTGELLYKANGTVSRAINIPGNPYSQSVQQTQQSGVVLADSVAPTPYLFGSSGTSWNYYDPLTGTLLRTITNVTASSYVFTDNDPMVWGYYATGQKSTPPYQFATHYVYCWNYTKVVNNDWNTGIVWKTNVNNATSGQIGPGDGSGRTVFTLSADHKYCVDGGGPGCNMAAGFDCVTGRSIWNTTFGYTCLNNGPQLFGTNYFVTYDPTYATWHVYSDASGQLVWQTSEVGTYPWDTKQGTVNSYTNDLDNLYVCSPDGTVVALSLKDGHKVWQSKPITSTEYASGTIPCWYGIVDAGGFIYAYLGYSPVYEIEPIPRFAGTICINATTGQTVWFLNGGVSPSAEANGYLLGYSLFDGIDYVIGKGQTKTTVSIQNDVISRGDSVMIKGTVLDQSPAQKDTPAVSDDSMSEWMDYMQMQNATLLNNPPKPKGVTVSLSAIDPNGNYQDIGTVTSDSMGNFAVMWKPSIEGIYSVTATFKGSGSYWSSSAETHFGVIAAKTATAIVTSTPIETISPAQTSMPTASPTATSAPPPTASEPTATYLAIGTAVVVIVIAAAALILRKRK